MSKASLIFLVGLMVVGASNARPPDGPSLPMPGQIEGRVIHVADGDTLTVLDGQRHERVIRLSDIDAPESGHGTKRPGQPFSRKASEHLKGLVLGREVIASCFDIDARKRDDGTTRERYICAVKVDGADVNLAMIDAGMAMAYRATPKFVRNGATYEHEEKAKRARVGLWSMPGMVPPWEWRKSCWTGGVCPRPDPG